MSDAHNAPNPPAAAHAGHPVFVLVALAFGVLAAAVGLVPGLLDGGILPLQNLWAVRTLPGDMPFALLPVSQYYATVILTLLVMGGVFAGLAVHVIARRRPIAAWAVALGVLLVQVVAVVQSFVVVADGLGIGEDGTGDPRAVVYFAGMLGGAIASVLLAQAGFWLTSRRSVGPVALGIGLAAVPFASWIGAGIATLTSPMGYPPFISELLRWMPAIIVGLALAWCGLRPWSRLGVWVGALLALGVTPALFTALSAAFGMRVLDGDLRAMAEVSMQVFPMALSLGVWPVAVAALIGAVGVAVRERRRSPAPESQPVGSN